MGEKEQADLDWLYRRDPATSARDAARAQRRGEDYQLPEIPSPRSASRSSHTDRQADVVAGVAPAADAPARGPALPHERDALAPEALYVDADPAAPGVQPAVAAPGSSDVARRLQATPAPARIEPARIEPAPRAPVAPTRPVGAPTTRPPEASPAGLGAAHAGIPADAPIRQPLSRRPAGATEDPLPPPPVGATPARPRVRRRRPLRLVLLALVLMPLLALGYLLGVPLMAWNGMDRVDDTPPGARPPAHPGTAVLLVGNDSRGQLTDAERWEIGIYDDPNNPEEVSRTDTMMLLYTPPSGKPVLISIPRDSWVTIPGHGQAKVNAAFAIGGPELLIQTLEKTTGFRIDGYAEIGFGGFVRVVKALGGLNVCVQNQVVGEVGYDTIEPGCQTLSARQALWFVRARHNDPEGDLGRAKRQRQFIGAIMKQVLSPGVLLNPGKYRAVTSALSKGMALGKDTSMGDAFAMANGMRGVAGGGGTSMVLPVANVDGWSSDGQSIVELDDEMVAGLFAQLNRGDTSNLEKFQR